MLVFRVLYLYYGAYACISDLILVFQNLFLYFRSYICITELIRTYSYTKVLVDTISRNISKLYQIHTRSDQTNADTDISP